ncbi:MAG TPA: hypothetical protein VF193_03450 [Steroidobacter sp.]|jgi:hypothetical protein
MQVAGKSSIGAFCIGLLVCAPGWLQEAWGYEPQPALYRAGAVVMLEDQDQGQDILRYSFSSRDISTSAFAGRTGAMIEVPLLVKGDACDYVQEVFRIEAPDGQEWQPGDVTHTFFASITLDARRREVTLNVRTNPLVEGVRLSDRVVAYPYPLLDKLPFEGLCAPGSLNWLRLRLFFNEYNLYISIAREGVPFEQVYSSPVNIGIGTTLMSNLTTGSDWLYISGVTQRQNTNNFVKYEYRASVFGLYWRFLENDPESRSNLIDNINLNYGAMALPVRAPFLEAASSAPAALASFIN